MESRTYVQKIEAVTASQNCWGKPLDQAGDLLVRKQKCALIDNPTALKRLPIEDLSLLAETVREDIVGACAKSGGHLSSSLGAVDLAIALHYVFDSPKDKIIWDVGHQAYAHKILTGRRRNLSEIRTFGGLSGFLSRKESVHDAFGAGHASTSISAAAGFAAATAVTGKGGRAIAVIGDGGLTGGMAFEALNHIGHMKSNVIVILNNNEISIAKNVGAISAFLSKKYTGYHISKLKTEIKGALGYLKGAGKNVLHVLKRLEKSVKALISPGQLFESFGFHYLGPIQGHDIEELVKFLKIASAYHGPVLLHINTEKGFGYEPAERDPYTYHGVTPFDPATGIFTKKTSSSVSFTEAFADSLVAIATVKPQVVAITAAMPAGTGIDKFGKKFPHRTFDVGISEQHAVTFAAGLAASGLRPVVAIYSTFLQRSYDQIIHDVCLQNLPVVFAIDRGGIVGSDGPTHHGVFDLAYLRAIPNLAVMAPADRWELENMLEWALNQEVPTAIRYPRGNIPDRELGKFGDSRSKNPLCADVIKRIEGKSDVPSVAIFSLGQPLVTCLAVAMQLAQAEGCQTSVVNMKSIKPLDIETLAAVARSHDMVVTVEDNTIQGGFGSAILEALADIHILKPLLRIGAPDKFIPAGTQQELRHYIGLDTAGILDKIRQFLEKS